ncbi:MAG TPA: UbiA family prenyltransferase [Methanomassiliicoccales archaeon]|nr:UbiA family prenyltransferase [Methanomassiliicoccales archaeon]
MNRFVQIFRLGNAAIAVLGLVLAVLVAAGTGLADSWQRVLVAAGVVFAFVAGGNALNDYLDREVDKLGHPERPIPSKRMKPETALRLSAGAFVISVLLSLLLWDALSIAIVLSAVAIMLGYELYTKKRGLAGNLSIAWLTGALFLLGGAVVGMIDRTLVVAAMAFLATLGREIVKDIEDMNADFDRRTLPKRVGRRNAGILGAAAILLAVVLSPEPYLVGTFGVGYLVVVAVADAIFIYSSIVQFRSPKQGQTLLKVAMLVALVSFLIGGIT